MAKLENPKHEEFARLLAQGLKQGDAYQKAGYSTNKGAASRLAASPRIVDRVEYHRKDIAQKVHTAMSVTSVENFETLADMGLTMDWVATQYQLIYEQSLAAGVFASANTAVNNIQKLIELEKNSRGDEVTKADDKISVKDTLALLQGMKEALSEPAREPDMVDITPIEDKT